VTANEAVPRGCTPNSASIGHRGQKISHWRGVRLRAKPEMDHTRFPLDCEQGRNFGLALRRSGENVLRAVESTNMPRAFQLSS
jgi:hypothetical protein